MRELEVFTFPETGQVVRTVVIDGQPWWAVADVCAAIGHSNASMAVKRLDPDEHITIDLREFPQVSATLNFAEGGRRGLDGRLVMVNEPGLYSLLIRSNLPAARPFKRWVTHEVLTCIRRSGSYTLPGATPADAVPVPQIPRSFAEALRLAAQQAEQLERQGQQLAAAEPKAQAWEVLAASGRDFSLREAAHILNRDPAITTGQNRLLRTLRELAMVDAANIPYARHGRHLRLRPQTRPNPTGDGALPARPQIRITAGGLQYLHGRLGGHLPLAYHLAAQPERQLEGQLELGPGAP